MEDRELLQAAPRHVAIIMDGNGRWAKARGLPRKVGHQQGVEAVRALVRNIEGLGLEYLTLYGFSSENWNRSPSEVSDLMGLLRRYIERDLEELIRSGVRIRIIGERDSLDADIVSLIDRAETTSRHNSRLCLTIAFNYGGRHEIAAAARAVAERVARGELEAEAVSAEMFAGHLYTAGLPDPDLVIRTSGEQRLSNFLIWQSAYSELVFVDRLWPDFTRADLEEAILAYCKRERRFGARPGEPKESRFAAAVAATFGRRT